MPRRFFRKFAIKRHQMAERWFLSPFKHMLHDPRLWGINRKNAVPAFSLGLFVGFMPFPGHPLGAALAALALRINIPIATLTTFISNPLTMPAIYYFCYRVGSVLLRREPQPFEFEPTFGWLTSTFVAIWQPMLLGSVLCGAIAALVGFIALDLLWRSSIARHKARKRSKRSGER